MSGPDCGRNHFGSCPPAWARDQTSRWDRPLSPARPHVSPREGETRPALQRPPAGRISIHSPCVRGRRDTRQNCGIAPAFRFILPRRGRLQNRLDKTGKSRRFPHVPAQGAMVPRAPWPRRGSHSTPSACAGCDHCPPNRPLFINLFRFTHPRGGGGATPPGRGAETKAHISIHAPARGATRRGFSTRRTAATFGSALSSTPSARPLSPVHAPARKEGPGQIAPGPLETVGPAYFTILATSEARSSSLFSMPSPFSKRANLTMEMLPPSSFATWAVYLATVRSWSLTKGCSSRQTSL